MKSFAPLIDIFIGLVVISLGLGSDLVIALLPKPKVYPNKTQAYRNSLQYKMKPKLKRGI